MPERFGEPSYVVAVQLTAGRLSPRQEVRAYELIDARLNGELSVAEIARHCSLSPSRFTVAFRNTTGVTPHRWLTERRVARAKSLLLGGNASLAQIALECGFADQSHFTHVFTATVGASPGEWRRAATA